MRIDEGLRRHIEERDASLRKNKGRFYHAYVDKLIAFLVPANKKVCTISSTAINAEGIDGPYGYVVLSDALGYVQDVQLFLQGVRETLTKDGRIVITQYSALWEPLLRFASMLHLREPSVEQNWLSPHDLRNFLQLADLEVVKEGKKMLLPVYVPLLSAFLNTIVANIWPFSHLGLIHYMVARPIPSAQAWNPSLSVIVPARNEAGTIERIVRELPELGAFTEIVFVEGHSKDNTLTEIKRVVASYKGTKKLLWAVQEGKGKGDAVRKGFDMATGDIVTIYDADMTVPPKDMEKFYNALVQGRGEFINGSRLVYPVEKGAMRLLNLFGNKFFSFAFSAILRQSLKDTLCGTKMLTKENYEDIQRGRSFFGDFDPFGDFDLLFGAAKLNLKIVEVPIRYQERVYGETNISRWSHGLLLLRMTAFASRKLVFW